MGTKPGSYALNVKQVARKLGSNEQGVTAVEYGLIAAIMGALSLVIVNSVSGWFNPVAAALIAVFTL